MAHLVLTIDSDTERRRQFLTCACNRLCSWQRLTVGQVEVGALGLAWGHGASAPRSIHSGADGVGWVFGHAIDDAGRRMDGQAILSRWLAPASPGDVFDGYHVAGDYSPDGGLAMGVDLLGLFPLCRADCGDVLLAGTSAELFAAHPVFSAELDVAGLTGNLLFNGLGNGQALLRGVRRVDVSHQLRWSAAKGTHEIQTWRFTPHDRHRHLAEASLLEQADTELRRAIRRHRPEQRRTTMMLSGGLDSRLMVGYLRSEGATEDAVCLGRPDDFEMRAAQGACRALGLPLHAETAEPDEKKCVELSHHVAHWEHLAGGFGGTTAHATGQLVGRHAPIFWSGYAAEDIVGGVAARFGREAASGRWSYETFVRAINCWGLPVDTLTGLVRARDSGEIIREHLDALRRDYERPEESPAQRAFRMKLATRTRYYIGSVLHRLCLHTWPLLPVLDRRMLDLHFNAPAEFQVDRRVEQRLVRSHFPHLAQVPIDTNSFGFEPLLQQYSPQASLLRKAMASTRKRLRRWYWRHWRHDDPRRYSRLYDLNNACGRALRVAAEAYRDSLGERLHREALDRLLPGPSVKLEFSSPFAASGGIRRLLGLMLWCSPRSATQTTAG